jgi:hypothetical protein
LHRDFRSEVPQCTADEDGSQDLSVE